MRPCNIVFDGKMHFNDSVIGNILKIKSGVNIDSVDPRLIYRIISIEQTMPNFIALFGAINVGGHNVRWSCCAPSLNPWDLKR